MVRRILQGLLQNQHRCLKHQRQVVTSGQLRVEMTLRQRQVVTSDQLRVEMTLRQRQLQNRSLNQLGSMLS